MKRIMKLITIVIALLFLVSTITAQTDPHFLDGRNTIVHLFEWPWADVANECETVLSPKGFAGVQISPPNENPIVEGRPWWEKYQPVSYILVNRGGDENSLADMISRCNAVGIRVYVDLVVNHMAAYNKTCNGTAGSYYNETTESYPAVPYTSEHFHQPECDIDFTNSTSIRDCKLSGLKDLNQTEEYVRTKIQEFMNHLIKLGVAGFRVDAAKHMWPEDLNIIFGSLDNLNTDFNFDVGARAFIYQEVIDTGDNDPVDNHEYLGFGRVCEFKFGQNLGNCCRGINPMHNLINWGTEWGLLPGKNVVSFVENHDAERDNPNVLTYKEATPYKVAITFMLAHSYDGITRIMSSYDFENHDQGPPSNGDDIISPGTNPIDGTCTNGWICQHRWSPIYNMVKFRTVTADTELLAWWSNNDNQIAFSRGDKGFYAATAGGDIDEYIETYLPDGFYCDVISGSYVGDECTGVVVEVVGGFVHVQLPYDNNNGGYGERALAIHVEAKLSKTRMWLDKIMTILKFNFVN